MMMATSSPSKISLLTLPVEVSKEILRNLLLVERNRGLETAGGPLNWPYSHLARDTNHFRDWWRRFNKMAEPNNHTMDRNSELFWARGRTKNTITLDLAVLRVCKQLYEQGIKILLEENKFIAIFGEMAVLREEMKWSKIWEPYWQWDAVNGCFVGASVGLPVEIKPVLSLLLDGEDYHEKWAKLVPAGDLPVVAAAMAQEQWRDIGAQLPFIVDLRIKSDAQPSDFGGNSKQEDIVDYLAPRLLVWIGESIKTVTVSIGRPDTVGSIQACVDLAESLISVTRVWRLLPRDKQTTLYLSKFMSYLQKIDQAIQNGHADRALSIFLQLINELQCFHWHPAIRPLLAARPDFDTFQLTDSVNAYWTIYSLACHRMAAMAASQTVPSNFIGPTSFLHWAIMRAEVPMIHFAHQKDWQLRTVLQIARLLIQAGSTRWELYDCVYTAADHFDLRPATARHPDGNSKFRDLKISLPSYKRLSLHPEEYRFPHPRHLTAGDIAGIDFLVGEWTEEVQTVYGEGEMSLKQV
jgi:hypothetical protein